MYVANRVESWKDPLGVFTGPFLQKVRLLHLVIEPLLENPHHGRLSTSQNPHRQDNPFSHM